MFRSVTVVVITAALIPFLAAPLASYAYDLAPEDVGTASGQPQEAEDFDAKAQRLFQLYTKTNEQLTAATLVLTALGEEFYNPDTGELDVPADRQGDWDEALDTVRFLLWYLKYLEERIRGIPEIEFEPLEPR